MVKKLKANNLNRNKEREDAYKALRNEAIKAQKRLLETGYLKEKKTIPTVSEYIQMIPSEKTKLVRMLQYVVKNTQKTRELKKTNIAWRIDRSRDAAITSKRTANEILNRQLNAEEKKSFESARRLDNMDVYLRSYGVFEKQREQRRIKSQRRKEQKRIANILSTHDKVYKQDAFVEIIQIVDENLDRNDRYRNDIKNIFQEVHYELDDNGLYAFAEYVRHDFDDLENQNFVYDSDGVGQSRGYIGLMTTLLDKANTFLARWNSDKEIDFVEDLDFEDGEMEFYELRM